MAQETETIKDVIFQISKLTEKNFGFSYNTEPKNKDEAYFRRTLAFLNQEDTIADVKNVINELSKKSTRFLLIDGENTFFNYTSSDRDRFIMLDILKEYLKKGIFIIIFCQNHSVHKVTGNTGQGRFKALRDFLLEDLYGFSDLFVFCNLKKTDYTHYNPLYDLPDNAPGIPNQSEIDDILLVHCFNKLKNDGKEVYVKTNDNFDWLNSNIDLLISIQKANIPSSYDIPDIRFDLKPRNFQIKVFTLESNYGKIKKTFRRVFRGVGPYTIKKSKGKKIKKKKKKTKKKPKYKKK